MNNLICSVLMLARGTGEDKSGFLVAVHLDREYMALLRKAQNFVRHTGGMACAGVDAESVIRITPYSTAQALGFSHATLVDAEARELPVDFNAAPNAAASEELSPGYTFRDDLYRRYGITEQRIMVDATHTWVSFLVEDEGVFESLPVYLVGDSDEVKMAA